MTIRNIKELLAAYSADSVGETVKPNTAIVTDALRRVAARLWAASQPEWRPGDVNAGCGSCWHCWNRLLREENFTTRRVLKLIKDQSTEAWPEYSGDIIYPVPAPAGYLSQVDVSDMYRAQHCYNHSPDCWVGEYGDTRRRLCAFQAEYLNKLLEDLQDGQD